MINEEKELNTATEDLQVYEVGYLLVPSIAVEKTGEESLRLKEIMTKNDGIFISDQEPELTTLAYRMSKVVDHKRNSFTSAYFGWVKFYLNPDKIEDLKKEVEGLDSILRFLIVKTEKDDTLTARKTVINPKEDGQIEKNEKKVVKKVEKQPVDEKEIDKSIEELVTEK